LAAPRSLQGVLTWFNTGSLGGGGETRVSARMRMDKDSMQQVRRLRHLNLLTLIVFLPRMLHV
jgi:hypothetical protein